MPGYKTKFLFKINPQRGKLFLILRGEKIYAQVKRTCHNTTP